MKTAKSLMVLSAFFSIFAGNLSAITSDELAAFLGVSAWHTTVDLPSDSYSIQIYEFADGKVSDADLIEVTKLTKPSENAVTIMAGTQDGKYKFVVTGFNGSYGAPTDKPPLDRTLSSHLPETIHEGDFILFGKPLSGAAFHAQDDIRSYSKGFLLRVKRLE